MFVHIVLFWLKPGTPDAAREQIESDCESLLKGISTVRQLWAGRPAMTPREVVDNSYDVGLCVVLDDAAGHDDRGAAVGGVHPPGLPEKVRERAVPGGFGPVLKARRPGGQHPWVDGPLPRGRPALPAVLAGEQVDRRCAGPPDPAAVDRW